MTEDKIQPTTTEDSDKAQNPQEAHESQEITLKETIKKIKEQASEDDPKPSSQLSLRSILCGELLTTQTLKWCNKIVHQELPELEHFHFHEFRHTYASTLVLNGADIKDVQELLGHSDIRITLNTYAHTTSQSRKSAVAIFENAIAK